MTPLLSYALILVTAVGLSAAALIAYALVAFAFGDTITADDDAQAVR